MRKRLAAALPLLLLMTRSPLAAQTIDAGDVKLRLIGRMQSQFNTTSVEESELIAAGRAPGSAIPSSTFEIRRVRLGTELEYEKWLTGKLEIEFTNARVQTKDLFLNMNFDSRFNVRVGQFKKPFSLLQLHSSTTWPVIERGVRIRGLNELMSYDDSVAGTRALSTFRGSTVLPEEQELLEVFGYQNFDIGAAIHGRFGDLGYNVAVFNGTGADRADDSDEKSYAARLTYKLPIDLPVTFASAVSRREFRVTNRPLVTDGGTAYEFDVEVGAFRRNGFHVLGEVAFGDNLAIDDDFLGAQAILAYFHPLDHARFEGIEFAARASYGDPRRDTSDDDSAWLITPGVNLYFFGRNRLMFNLDLFNPSGERFSNEHALRAQAQFSF